MPVVLCPYCREEVESRAAKCPACGCELQVEPAERQRRFISRNRTMVALVFFALLVGLGLVADYRYLWIGGGVGLLVSVIRLKTIPR